MGMLGPLFDRKSDLSVWNGVLLYKQQIRPLMDYASPAWSSAARSHVRKLQVLQSKRLLLATSAPWYVSNRQIHEDLGVPLLADHIRALTESFDLKLADVGNPLLRQLGRHLSFPRADPVAWRESQGRQGTAGQSRRPLAVAKSTNEWHSAPNFKLNCYISVKKLCSGLFCKGKTLYFNHFYLINGAYSTSFCMFHLQPIWLTIWYSKCILLISQAVPAANWYSDALKCLHCHGQAFSSVIISQLQHKTFNKTLNCSNISVRY